MSKKVHPELLLFLQSEKVTEMSSIDKLFATLYWHSKNKTNGDGYVSPAQILTEIDEAEHTRPSNRTVGRLKAKSCVKKRSSDNRLTITLTLQKELDRDLSPLLSNKSVVSNDSLLSSDDFAHTPYYVRKVVTQINKSYEEKLYDCCAVMIRRLMETLLIELFEIKGCADSIKTADGNYVPFAQILSEAKNSSHLGIAKASQSLKKLSEFKTNIADRSAHQRTFIASKSDISNNWEGLKRVILDINGMACPPKS